MKKHLSSLAAIAAAAALCATVSATASAADWSKTGYADDDPNTVKIISTSPDGITFTQGTPGGSCKARITYVDVLANPEDISKVKSGSWDVTYTGLESLNGTEIGWMGGGAYVATCNSAGFGLSPVDYTEDGLPIWEDVQTVQDSFKYLLPSHVPASAEDAEIVLMDWSGQDLVANNITVTISNFKLFDADGNEIAQKEYSGDAAAEEAPAEEAPAAEEAVAETEAAPAADTDATPVAATGNTAAASIAAVMAVAGAAALISKRK